MADEPPLPDGWEVVTYARGRPNEYWYYNSVTNKEVRVLERPTEPPPEGVELLRNEKNASGWTGISLVKNKFYGRWFDVDSKMTRSVPGVEGKTAEEAAALLYDWIKAGADWLEPTQQRKYARNTKPPPKKRAKTAEAVAEDGDRQSQPMFVPLPAGSSVKNATMAAFLARGMKPAPRTADIDPADMAAFLALDGSGEVA